MRNFKILFFFLLTSCLNKKISKPFLKEFIYYPNNNNASSIGSLSHYYFIENAPEDDNDLLYCIDNLSKAKMNLKFNDTIKKVTFFFFTDKGCHFISKVDEAYQSEGPTVEDYYNPRRAEYTYLKKNNKIVIHKTIYKNERAVIPKIIFAKYERIDSKKFYQN